MAEKRSTKTLNPEDVFIDAQARQLQSISIPAPGPAIEFDDVTALNNVLNELGAEEDAQGFVVVEREFKNDGNKWDKEYLDRFPVTDFSLDMLKSRYGAGKYKISVYHGDSSGLATRKTINIARDLNAIAAPVMQSAAAPIDLTPVLQTMQQGFEKMFAAIMQTQQKAPSRAEMLQEMAMMRDMFKTDAPAAPAYGNPIEMMKLGMEMAANAGSGGESNNAWVNKVIDQLGPVLMPALADSINRQPVTHANPAPQLSAPVPRPATQPALQPKQENDPVSLLITNYLALLKNAAKQQAPVEEYADSILSMVPASNVSDIEKLLRPDNWRDTLRQQTTVADEYPDWFTNLRNVLLQYIDEDKAEASTHLTQPQNSVSVDAHENATLIDGANPAGDPASLA